MKKNRNIIRLIAYIHRKSQLSISKKLKEIDISLGEFMYILAIPEDVSVSLGYLSERLAFDPAMTTKSINSLIKKGVVTKNQLKCDKRVFDVSLTERGKELKTIIDNIVEEWNNTLLSSISSEESSILENTLIQLKENLIKHDGK